MATPTITPNPQGTRHEATFKVDGLAPVPARHAQDGTTFTPDTLRVGWSIRPNGDIPAPWTLELTGPILTPTGAPHKTRKGKADFTTIPTFARPGGTTLAPEWMLDVLDTLGIPTAEARQAHANQN